MHVQVREGEPFEELYRRFRRGMEASGILREYRRKQRFIPVHEARRARRSEPCRRWATTTVDGGVAALIRARCYEVTVAALTVGCGRAHHIRAAAANNQASETK